MKNDYKNYKKNINLFEYKDTQGSFDYELYKQCQIALNRAKIYSPGPNKQMMASLYNNIIKKFGKENIEHGVCHGTRRGSEQRYLRELLGDVNIFGTEISPTAKNFEKTVQWDFHEIKPEWINKFDLIYSNSLDQSYDPIYCLTQWLKTLSVGGICIIHIYGAMSDKEVTQEERDRINLEKIDERLPNNLPKHAGDPFIATRDGYKEVCYSAILNLEDVFSISVEKESGRECIVIKKELA